MTRSSSSEGTAATAWRSALSAKSACRRGMVTEDAAAGLNPPGVHGMGDGGGAGALPATVQEGVVVSRRRQVSTMWGQLAAIRCWECWKDRAWGNGVSQWLRDKLELSALIRLQVFSPCQTPAARLS